MGAKQLGKTLNSKELNKLIHPLRKLNNTTNLFYLLFDYCTLIAILSTTISFCYFRESWGISWYWNIPVVAIAIALVGAVQHRLAGLTHEAAHYILFKNRYLNELCGDLFCIFPLFATTEQYRMVHLGHHQYVNDWEKDPELLNLGQTRSMDRFPMTKKQFIYHFYIRIFWPPVLMRYLWDNIYVTAVARGVSPYKDENDAKAQWQFMGIRLTSLLGVSYVFGMIAAVRLAGLYGNGMTVILTPILGLLAAGIIAYLLPEKMYYQSPFVRVYSAKFASVLRLGFFTALIGVLGGLRFFTGYDWAIYFWLLWVVPLLTSFPYYMLLRDIYQHANADDGKLTNSRVFFTDPLTHWAFFIYGQGVHVTHHLYPAIPHYNLMTLHRLLQDKNEEYGQHVVECHGFFSNRKSKPSILDVMELPTREPLDMIAHDHANDPDPNHQTENDVIIEKLKVSVEK